MRDTVEAFLISDTNLSTINRDFEVALSGRYCVFEVPLDPPLFVVVR